MMACVTCLSQLHGAPGVHQHLYGRVPACAATDALRTPASVRRGATCVQSRNPLLHPRASTRVAALPHLSSGVHRYLPHSASRQHGSERLNGRLCDVSADHGCADLGDAAASVQGVLQSGCGVCAQRLAACCHM